MSSWTKHFPNVSSYTVQSRLCTLLEMYVCICSSMPRASKPCMMRTSNFSAWHLTGGQTLRLILPLQGKVSHYVFVASAGAYVPDGIHAGLKEGDKRKESAGHVPVEQYLQSEGLPYTVFQPLYIYGPHTAKDCEQWFLDRILRDRPVPIPAPGIQLVALSHVEDVAAMLAKVCNWPEPNSKICVIALFAADESGACLAIQSKHPSAATHQSCLAFHVRSSCSAAVHARYTNMSVHAEGSLFEVCASSISSRHGCLLHNLLFPIFFVHFHMLFCKCSTITNSLLYIYTSAGAWQQSSNRAALQHLFRSLHLL